MSIRFVIGRAGSGKSRFCLEELKTQLFQKPQGHPLVFLVPEQATFQMEHALITSPQIGGMLRAQVLSFRRMAWRVMQETGGTALVPIDDSGKKMLLHKLMLQHQEELGLFRSSVHQLGLIDKLNELFSEFRRYDVTPESLEQQAEALENGGSVTGLFRSKLRDVQHLYGLFTKELVRHYADSEDILTMLAGQFGESSLAGQAEVWVDGFNGFTPQEYAIIGTFMKHARRLTITLCLDKPYSAGERPHELDMFHPTATTMIRLQQLALEHAGDRTVEVVRLDQQQRFAGAAEIAHLERHYDTKRPFKETEQRPAEAAGFAGIELREAANRRAEVEGAAREMIRLARDEGLRWRDMTVLVRNLEGYGDLLRTTFADYHIPIFMDHKRSILHHPMAELIRSVLEAVARNWRYDAIFRAIKTGFFLPRLAQELPELSRSEITMLLDRLENMVLAYGIQGISRWTEAKPWRVGRAVTLEGETVAADRETEQLEQRLNRCRLAIAAPLEQFQRQLRQAGSVQDQVEALFSLLTGLDAPGTLEQWSAACIGGAMPEKAKEHAQVWDSIIDMLDQLVEMMGAEKLDAGHFADIVDTGLESIQLGLVPPSLDQVLIGSMDRTRSRPIQVAFILGASEGVMPAVMSEDGVLTENEREALTDGGLELANGSRRKLLDERFMIYTALTLPSRKLWLSYPLADEEGGALLPSEIVRHLGRLFPGMKAIPLQTEPDAGMSDAEQLHTLAAPDKALSYLVAQLREWRKQGHIGALWWDTYNWFASQPEWGTRLASAVRSLFFTNRALRLQRETSRELYGEHLLASVSRMERFVACPFSHFSSHGLRLRERPVFRLEAPDIGELFHAALSAFASQLLVDRMSWGDLTAEECLRRASTIVDGLVPRLQGEILLSSKRYHYIARKLKSIVGRASIALGEHARRSQFQPLALELGFGPGQQLPPLEFRLDNGSTMNIIGRIDRVDQAEGDDGLLLRIVDYKSSQTSLKLAEVYYGLSLQTLTYLDVVITHAEQWLGRKATPSGALYFHVHHPLLKKVNGVPAEQAERELFKRYKMKGMVRADLETVRLMDGELRDGHGTSDLLPVGIKKDGGFTARSSIMTDEEWKKLQGHVRKVIRRIGTEVTEGVVDISPYKLGKHTACTFCPYKPVCQFDPLLDGCSPNALAPVSQTEVWRRIEMEAEPGIAQTDIKERTP
ncbi:helicase-exonuclease AddAB subunit AddB [Paenibacillus sp. y28]|uniref:helicase-exonuclease AddAB subunit AddB n=1 Tax=Paenibacillus sp. y28 TaxID=3129110 RepID=UPI00301A8F2C